MSLYIGKKLVVSGYVPKGCVNYEAVGYVTAPVPYGKKCIMLDAYYTEANEQGDTLIIGYKEN